MPQSERARTPSRETQREDQSLLVVMGEEKREPKELEQALYCTVAMAAATKKGTCDKAQTRKKIRIVSSYGSGEDARQKRSRVRTDELHFDFRLGFLMKSDALDGATLSILGGRVERNRGGNFAVACLSYEC
jgi:hypothetical protein